MADWLRYFDTPTSEEASRFEEAQRSSRQCIMAPALHSMGASLALRDSLWRTFRTTVKTRQYATQHQTSLGTTTSTARPRRQSVTVFNDDGRVKWGDLTAFEKAARTTQQTFNFVLIGVGAIGAIGAFTFLYTDVFSSDSSISQYNEAVDRVRSDPGCIAALGSQKEISALGDPTGTSWIRNRPRAAYETDKFGTERMRMNFRVSGPLNKGTVRLLMIRRQDEKHWHYGHLLLDIPGRAPIYLERGDERQKTKNPRTIFGIPWG